MINPYGCKWCGIDESIHYSRFVEPVGQHVFAAPTEKQIKNRMEFKPMLINEMTRKIEK